MRKFMFLAFGLIALLILAAIIIPLLIPSSVYKSAIQAQLSERLARDVEIKGDVKISPLPSLKVKVGAVDIENPEGFSSAYFAQMESLDVRIRLIPLLSKKVEISAFELNGPTIQLEKMADGSANWVLGQKQEDSRTDASGPFKRDGRFADLKASLGTFTITNGSIDYSDAVTGRTHKLTDVNVKLSMPSLTERLTADGSLVLDRIPADIELSLETPRKFLDGEKTPVSMKLGTLFGDIGAKGYFTESEDFHFAFDVIGSVRDLNPLSRIFPTKISYSELADSIEFSGNYAFDGQKIDAKNTDIKIAGSVLNSRFTGDAIFAESFGGDGQVEIHIKDFQKLTRLLELETPLNDTIQNIDINSSIRTDGETILADNLTTNFNGIGLAAEFSGKGQFGKQIALDGRFSSQIASIPDLAKRLGLEKSQLAALGDGEARGTFSLDGTHTRIELDQAKTNGPNLTASYIGEVNITDSGVTLDGTFEGLIPELARMAEVSGAEFSYAQSIRRLETTGSIKGHANDLTFDNMQIKLSNGELNGQFEGQANLNDGFILDGRLDAEIPSARRLTRTTTGVELPPSTDAGQIYEKVAISGNVTGNPAGLRFSNADLSMDAIDGNGEFQLDLTTDKPTLKGTLDMGQIDLRPYMAAYSAGAEGIQPWSEVPYDFSALNIMDGNYILKTPEVVFGPLAFGQTDLNAVVKNGVMTARLPEVNLYGGLGVMTATLDASSEIPKVKLAVTLEDITSNRFLNSLANFTKLEGTGHTLMEISGEGRSQAEIMRSLNGYGDFEVIGGVIKGIDLSKFLTGVDESLTQRILPQGIGEKYATNFNDMVGKFKIKDGVISLDNFNLKAAGVHAGGSGMLDIGNQKLDFGLRPRLTTADASDFGRYGIPIRFKGNWGNISPGPDFDLLQKIAVEKAKIRAREEITDRVGGEIGGVLGGILGVPKKDGPSVPESDETRPNDSTSKNQAETDSEISDDVAPTEAEASTSTDTKDDLPVETTEETESNIDPKKPAEQQLIEGALEGLFGKKKATAEEE